MDPKNFDDLARKLAESVPGPLRQMQEDVEKNFRTIIQNAFARMNLVTREQFDVQTGVLARSRSLVDALEKRVAVLEEELNIRPAGRQGTKTERR